MRRPGGLRYIKERRSCSYLSFPSPECSKHDDKFCIKAKKKGVSAEIIAETPRFS
nr:MAG TPA: hypothetical protein [Caudoviricetes sp.]